MKKLLLSFFACALVSLAASAKVYRPGLIQAKFGTNKLVTESATWPKPQTGLFSRTDCDIDYTYEAFMANRSANDQNVKFTNPYTGTQLNWDEKYSAFCYEGEIFLHAGEDLVMVGRFDDGSAAMVDGTILFDQEWAGDSGYNKSIDMTKLVAIHAAADGWHPIACIVFDWTGGKNIKDWVSGMQYNLNGCKTDPNKGEKWAKLVDPGDGSFLRFATAESFMTLGTIDVDGDDVLVDASFADVPFAAELRAYYGASDGGEFPAAWANSVKLADIAAGTTAVATYRLVGLKDAANIRLCLINPANNPPDNTAANEAFYEFSSRLALDQTAPIVEAVSVTPGYTDATMTIALTGFGLGATTADVVVELSDSDTFEPVLKTIQVATGMTQLGQREVVIGELNTNTTYYVRGVATNDKGVSGTGNSLEFKTLLPTAANGSFNIYSINGNSETFTAKVTDYGFDSSDASITMQCSTTEDFADVFESDTIDLSGDVGLDAEQTMTVSGLSPGVKYFSRLKMENTWGFVSYTAVQQYETTATVVLQGIGYESSANGFDVSVVIPTMDEASATITLYADGSLAGSRTITAAGSYVFQVAASGTVELRAVVTFGGSSVEAAVTATRGASSSVIADPASCSTAATAILLDVGDTVVFPPTVGNARYVNLSGHRFLSQSGNVFTALEPGIAAVEVYGADGALVGTAVVLVKPDMQQGGRVFIYDPSARNEKWSKQDWVVPGSDGKVAGPEDPKDVAFVLFREDGGNFCIDGEHTVQDVYFGRPFNSVKDARIYGPGTLTVCGVKAKKSARPGKVMFCSCANGDLWWNVYFGAYKDDTGLRWTVNVADNDVEIDLGGPSDKFYPTKNSKANQVQFHTDNSLVDFVIPEGRKLSFVNGADRKGGRADGQGWGDSYYYFVTADAVRGSGVFEFALPGVSTIGANFFRQFEGEIVDSYRNFVTEYSSDRGGAFWTNNGNLNITNATLTLAGYLDSFSISKSVGVFASGCHHSYGDPGSQKENGLPLAGVKLNGGYMKILGYNKAKANFMPCTYAGADDYEAHDETDVLTIAGGLSELDMNIDLTGDNLPVIHFIADDIVHEDSGSLFVLDRRTLYPGSDIRVMIELNGLSDHYVGNTTVVDLDNDVFPIVPWMATYCSSDDLKYHDRWWWAHIGSDNVMCRGGTRTNISLSSVVDPLRNVYCSGTGVALTEDVTVNSLVLEGESKEKKLGAGRKLTITSGGLIIKDKDSGFGDAMTPAENGSLLFPNRAYVWACTTDGSKPGVIWSPVTAPNGFCLAGSGQLRIGGDQTGIDGDITVNNGTLQLGDTSGNGCTVDVPIRLVGGATKLQVNKSGTLDDLTLDLSCPGGYGPKITVPAAGERCLKVYVDGESLPRGTYGAIGSGAQYESEYIAAGSGLLKVRKDDCSMGTRIIVR